MWTLQYQHNGLMKAKEFRTKEEALSYGVEQTLSSELIMEDLISPDKKIAMDHETLRKYYIQAIRLEAAE
ncbi:hypothetical protein P8918_13730 [Bacillus spizizenii]|nr:hypothetical protein [Bacillus spizizenii]MEC0842089.1 hypothetical protein [Bacillus spizizenii]